MTIDQLYWVKPPYRCPACNKPFEKPITKASFDKNKENFVPIWKCIYCSKKFIRYVNDELAKLTPDISSKYLKPDVAVEEKKMEDEKKLEKQKSAWQKKQKAINKKKSEKVNSENSAVLQNSKGTYDEEIRGKALSCLKQAYGENAEFREGQYEAIEASLTKKRTLVVQRTGWGKSLVYFIVTKLIREKNKGVTIVISPLLALMENQQKAAEKFGLKCDCLNSETKDRREEIIENLKAGNLDLVLVTPETMFTNDIQEAIKSINIGFFVIDEAHCISDWGHDFRLEYCRLKNVIKNMLDVPILTTTATANDRVIEDLKKQLGDKVYISRGHLMRDNLSIQVLKLQDRTSRYAWLLDNIPKLDGTGIVYCLTQRDCENLATFLYMNGIRALSYYSRETDKDNKNQDALKKFMNNEIKVLVSTVKLGMGFDKSDVSFIVHFQMPANVVTYYQQIGRAGRGIAKAYTFLMSGKEDADIHNYFIQKAFPTEQEMRDVLGIVKSNECVSKSFINSKINISNSRLEKALAFLLNDGYILKEGNKFQSLGKEFHYDGEHYEQIRQRRHEEINQMFDLVNTKECYNRYIINLLNDDTKVKCGCCSNCVGEIFSSKPSDESSVAAKKYIEKIKIEIVPRKKWAVTAINGTSCIRPSNQPGICISRYGDAGYGELVKMGKYSTPARFDDKLVNKGAEILADVIYSNHIQYITCVPSLRSDIVMDYTMRLAEKTGLKFIDTLGKKDAEQQKRMENSYYQCQNALESFYYKSYEKAPEKIILVDDIVDSRWTLTVCGYLLSSNGSNWVFPFALAESSKRDDI